MEGRITKLISIEETPVLDGKNDKSVLSPFTEWTITSTYTSGSISKLAIVPFRITEVGRMSDLRLGSFGEETKMSIGTRNDK